LADSFSHACLDGHVVRAHPQHFDMVVAIDRQLRAEITEWITGLRIFGVKAARPDDGWVDRLANRLKMEYPDFDDGLQVGDLLALGCPWGVTRIVRVTRIEPDLNPFALPSEPLPPFIYFESVS
jgi:hypothetical protein